MTTKEQELKALEQIKKIVAGLGENSYVATAFEGCFEIAADNIKNDFACSMKQRAESAEKKSERLELDNRDLRLAVKRAKEQASKKETELEELLQTANSRVLSVEDLTDIRTLVSNEAEEEAENIRKCATQIVLFAEVPELDDFKQAVTEHRERNRRRDYLLGIQSRIEKALYN